MLGAFNNCSQSLVLICLRIANDFDVRVERYDCSVKFLKSDRLKRKVKSNKGQVPLGGRGRRITCERGTARRRVSPKKTLGCHRSNKEQASREVVSMMQV